MTPLAEDRLPVPKEARELGAASCTDDLLREARAGLARVDVADLDRMFADGALLVCNEGYGSSAWRPTPCSASASTARPIWSVASRRG